MIKKITTKTVGWTLFICLFMIIPFAAFAGLEEKPAVKTPSYPEQEWGIGVMVRFADIPFNTADDTVESFIPLMYYEGDYFFLNGLEGGVKVYTWGNSRIDLLGRMRFFDIPRDFQNYIQEDTVDFGLRYRYGLNDHLFTDFELLTDSDARWHSNARITYEAEYKRLDLSPFFNLRFKSSSFNDNYFGLTREKVGSGLDVSLGLDGRCHIWDNIYLTGRVQSTWFEKDVRDLSFINKDRVDELRLGLEITNKKNKIRKQHLGISPYWRFSHGWATPEGLDKIFAGQGKLDPHNNQLSSIFYGHPLTDDLFGIPFEIYLTPGFLWHWKSSVQSSSQEYVLAIKADYTFTWPIRWRVGAAEGISYVSDIPFVEQSEMDRNGYEASKLMNYLDFSLDVNTGDLFSQKSLTSLYFGYAIHHRSAIYGSVSHFGRISGGSNYHTLYLQYHY